MTSLSVSDRKTWPRALSELPEVAVVLDDAVVDGDDVSGRRSGAGGRCVSDGLPWVAQRVWPRPVVPFGADRC